VYPGYQDSVSALSREQLDESGLKRWYARLKEYVFPILLLSHLSNQLENDIYKFLDQVVLIA
jgi:hypothetical protein